MIKAPKHLIIISVVVFLGLNLLENLIHFSIGRNIEKKDDVTFEIKWPNLYDFVKIVFVMVLFGLLQGYLTYWAVQSGY